MPDILHDFPINAPIEHVFDAFSTPEGLDAWWTLRAAGEPRAGATYEFYFGESYDWRGVVSRLEPGRLIEWQLTQSDADWSGTRVGVELTPTESGTQVRFWHRGWRDPNSHYRTSSFCWAMYLRLLKRWVETGEVVPYARRLEAWLSILRGAFAGGDTVRIATIRTETNVRVREVPCNICCTSRNYGMIRSGVRGRAPLALLSSCRMHRSADVPGVLVPVRSAERLQENSDARRLPVP